MRRCDARDRVRKKNPVFTVYFFIAPCLVAARGVHCRLIGHARVAAARAGWHAQARNFFCKSVDTFKNRD